MTLEALERAIVELQAQPLSVLCRTPMGQDRIMNVPECMASGSSFIHVVDDELDALLACELKGVLHDND